MLQVGDRVVIRPDDPRGELVVLGIGPAHVVLGKLLVPSGCGGEESDKVEGVYVLPRGEVKLVTWRAEERHETT